MKSITLAYKLSSSIRSIEDVITRVKSETKGKQRKQRCNNFSSASTIAQIQLNQFD